MTGLVNTQQQTQFNILLIGDSCTDLYSIGTVDRISPEAPVPVLKINERKSVPGMAANVYKNLTNLNCNITFITNTEEIIKERFIDERSGQQMLRVDSEPRLQSYTKNHTVEFINQFDAVVISDYDKGFLTYGHMEWIVQNAQCPVFIDTKKTSLACFQGAWVKINQLEYSRLVSECSGLIVTKGSDGASCQSFDIDLAAPKVEVADVCGAGDTFLSALTVQYLLTKDIKKAILFANIAASITVQHRGNYAPSYDEIRVLGY